MAKSLTLLILLKTGCFNLWLDLILNFVKVHAGFD